MKKLLGIFAILSIVLSVSLLFSCESGSACCQEQHSSSSQCSTCSPHMEASLETSNLYATIIFTPKILGQIFFRHINVAQKNVIFSPDRPPAQLS